MPAAGLASALTASSCRLSRECGFIPSCIGGHATDLPFLIKKIGRLSALLIFSKEASGNPRKTKGIRYVLAILFLRMELGGMK